MHQRSSFDSSFPSTRWRSNSFHNLPACILSKRFLTHPPNDKIFVRPSIFCGAHSRAQSNSRNSFRSTELSNTDVPLRESGLEPGTLRETRDIVLALFALLSERDV
ncbi:hypothetical protein TNIN_458691 [Trichonephila inaurata madagascariensis]|uniref:Uncharacterized protein n=1 Tax=Trichonephila inaurata madagascariensis TaxID=2747483 RepID=A0A8X6XLN1_9ARAC|nr:hypothetical protein TNIN_458691 [Trichonephila inaurata madagascariensis]